MFPLLLCFNSIVRYRIVSTMGRKKKGSSQKKASSVKQPDIRELEEEFERAGTGLLQSQTDLKKAPWRLTLAKLDLILKNQEETLKVLNDILEELKKRRKD